MYFSHSDSETSESTLMNTDTQECNSDSVENDEYIINRFEEEGLREYGYDDEGIEHYSVESYEYDATSAIANTRSLYRRLLSDLTVEPETQDNTIVSDYYDHNDFWEVEEDSDYYEIQRIYEKEYLFLDSEKINNKYYIGIYTVLDEYMNQPQSSTPIEIVLGSCISPSTFFEFPIKNIQQYLSAYSIIYSDRFSRKNVDILKLCISERDGTYTVIVKTTWLRMFQRKWRKIYAEKKRDMKHRMKLSSMRHFEVYGKWPPKHAFL